MIPSYTVKFQRSETRRLGRVYFKHQIVIPKGIVSVVGWQPQAKLDVDRKGRIIVQLHPPETKPKKLTYEDFREQVHQILLLEPNGLTWSKIRERAPNLPIKPNALWVRMLGSEIGLKRLIQEKTYQKIWRIEPLDRGKLNAYMDESHSQCDKETGISHEAVTSGLRKELCPTHQGSENDTLKGEKTEN